MPEGYTSDTFRAAYGPDGGGGTPTGGRRDELHERIVKDTLTVLNVIPGLTLWRNDTGRHVAKCPKCANTVHGRSYGTPGVADILGWYTITALPRPVAVAVAVEVKTGRGKRTPGQGSFAAAATEAGAIYLLVREDSDPARMFRAAIAKAL